MNYLGITVRTAEWLLTNSSLLEAFKDNLKKLAIENNLSNAVVGNGPIRATAFQNNLLCIWNTDYLSGTDTEDWGFIQLTSELGVLNNNEIYNEVIERCLTLISLRLQGLNLPDDRFIHRSLGDNLHTCLAGRGNIARQSSLAYYEDKITIPKGSFHSLLIIGPSNTPGYDRVIMELNSKKTILPKLLQNSNDLLVQSRKRPLMDSKYFEEFRSKINASVNYDIPIGDKELEESKINDETRYVTVDWKYDDWVKDGSPLTPLQREILDSDVILKQPLRIVGAAGTGKSLIMELLALKRLNEAKQKNNPLSILYIVHNSEMANTIRNKFVSLGGNEFISLESEQRIIVKTLFEYACEELKLDDTMIMDRDAAQTKMFQRFTVSECIDEIFLKDGSLSGKSDLLKKISENYELRDVFADIVASEIGIGIKGRDLAGNKKKYVESDRPFTRFHGILNSEEREFVFEIFTRYNDKVNNKNGLLDSDDIAISFLGTLKTPLWGLRRKKLAFDFVFIDETQLFNQNERQIFKFLTKTYESYLPIVIALDEAQEIRGSSTAGFGVLGIEHLANETLPNVHRCTEEILKLAFFVIQRTTDLFGPDFPDFTTSTTTLVKIKNGGGIKPRLLVKNESSLGAVVKKEISNLRRSGLRQIAVIIHPEKYFWEIVGTIAQEKKENIIIAEKRGELIDPKKPIIYLSRPDLIGGQEFDAVIAVGLEHGVIPPIITGHVGLSEALEQQALREMYLSFTRAKYSLTIINSKNSAPTGVIKQAISEGIINNEVLVEK